MPISVPVSTAIAYGGTAVNALSVRDSLVALGELVARDAPGVLDEHSGLAHERIATFFTGRLDPSGSAEAHLRVAQIMQRTPNGSMSETLNYYGKRHLSDHLLLAGRPEDAINELVPFGTPADTLNMWESWLSRLSLPSDQIIPLFWRCEVISRHGWVKLGGPEKPLRALQPCCRIWSEYLAQTIRTLWPLRAISVFGLPVQATFNKR